MWPDEIRSKDKFRLPETSSHRTDTTATQSFDFAGKLSLQKWPWILSRHSRGLGPDGYPVFEAKSLPAAEAFLLQLTRKGLQGDSSAAWSSLAAIETARASGGTQGAGDILRVILVTYGVGMVLMTPGMGVKLNPFNKERFRWELQPWIVEAALARLAGRVLTADEQREVWHVTRRPKTVDWPEWWTCRG